MWRVDTSVERVGRPSAVLAGMIQGAVLAAAGMTVAVDLVVLVSWRLAVAVVLALLIGKEDSTGRVLVPLARIGASVRCVRIDTLERGATVIAMDARLRSAVATSAIALARPLALDLRHQTTTTTASGQHLGALCKRK